MSRQHSKSSISIKFTLMLCVSLFAVSMIPGCSGCRRDPTAREEEKKKKRKKPRDAFEVAPLAIQPSDDTLTGKLVKPGHWMIGMQKMRANNDDFQAEIFSRSTDKDSNSIPVQSTEFTMNMTRPASLPKGQIKHFEMIYYIPRSMPSGRRQVWLQSRLRSRRTGAEVTGSGQPTLSMEPHEYFLVVLSSEPDKYAYLKRLDAVRPPTGGFSESDTLNHYRVVLPKIKRRVPLPSHPLAWSTMAYKPCQVVVGWGCTRR